MKNLLSALMIVAMFSGYSQENLEKRSFLTRNNSAQLFGGTEAAKSYSAFKLKLPSNRRSDQLFHSEYMTFMPTNSRLMNYPARNLGENNNVTFGTFSINTMNLGRTKMQTFYFFDHTGRLVDTTTSFSFGK